MRPTDTEHDIAVIGGGPAGYVAALRAAQLGAQTLLIERERVGGTCLNVGCVPTKTLLFNAKVYRYLGRLGELGLNADSFSYDFGLIQKRKEHVVNKFVRGVEYLLKKRGVEVIHGEATMDVKRRLTVRSHHGEMSLSAHKILIATGSSPARLSLPGAEHTIVELMESIIPGEDREITMVLSRALKKQGITIHTSSKVARIDSQNGRLRSLIHSPSGEKEILADKVLLSVGRVPNTGSCEELSLAQKGGFIDVNEKMETSSPGVYAAGDVCGKWLLAYTASKEGEVAVSNALGIADRMDYTAVPRLIYSHPEVGAVGLTEEEAQKEHDIVVGRFPMIGNARAYAELESEGLVKVIADKKDERILGITVLGPYATELVLSATIFLAQRMNLKQAQSVIYGHPVFSECIREAILDAQGKPLHK